MVVDSSGRRLACFREMQMRHLYLYSLTGLDDFCFAGTSKHKIKLELVHNMFIICLRPEVFIPTTSL